MYIADTYNYRIRKVTSTGVISTVVGGTLGYSGDGGLATSAAINFPNFVVFDSSGLILKYKLSTAHYIFLVNREFILQ